MPREFFLHLRGVYHPSVNYLSIRLGCTIPPRIISLLGRDVHFLRELFIHIGGVYHPSVNYLSTLEGCTIPP